MSDIQEKTKNFMQKCTEDALSIYSVGSVDRLELISQYTLIQIIGKMFELEAKIRELENDRV